MTASNDTPPNGERPTIEAIVGKRDDGEPEFEPMSIATGIAELDEYRVELSVGGVTVPLRPTDARAVAQDLLGTIEKIENR